MIFRIAFRNVFRHKKRSLFTALTMFGAFVLASISIGIGEGMYTEVIDKFTRSYMGHIQVHREGYLDRPTLYKTIDDYEKAGQVIAETEGVDAWAPRLKAGGLAFVGDQTSGANILGVDPGLEERATFLSGKITEGSSFTDSHGKHALVGVGLLEILDARVGDSLVIVSQAADGSIANDIYHITGAVESGDEMRDRSTVYLPLSEAQELFVLPGRVHEIVVMGEKVKRVRELAKRISRSLANPELSVSPWQVFASSFYEAMQADKQGNYITQVVVMIIVAVGVLNTVLMSVLERTHEYGVLKAMGTRPSQIFMMILLEVGIITTGCIVLGSGVGTLVNYIFTRVGIEVPTAMEVGGFAIETMVSEINAKTYWMPGVIVFTAAMLVSLFPAIKAARTVPVEAMRTR